MGENCDDIRGRVHGVSFSRVMARQAQSIVAARPVGLPPPMAQVQDYRPGSGASVRNGTAGNPARFSRLQAGLSAQA